MNKKVFRKLRPIIMAAAFALVFAGARYNAKAAGDARQVVVVEARNGVPILETMTPLLFSVSREAGAPLARGDVLTCKARSEPIAKRPDGTPVETLRLYCGENLRLRIVGITW